jgi:hypothetical protein
MDLPNQPLKEWPQKVSCQLWHLNIIVYFMSGAIGISFPLLFQFGARALVSNIVVLVIDRAQARFDRLRGIYEAFKPQIAQMTEAAILTVEQLMADNATDTQIQSAFVLGLCQILLSLRAEPYTRNAERMARLEVRRLRDIVKAEGMLDGPWIIEMTSRLRN